MWMLAIAAAVFAILAVVVLVRRRRRMPPSFLDIWEPLDGRANPEPTPTRPCDHCGDYKHIVSMWEFNGPQSHPTTLGNVWIGETNTSQHQYIQSAIRHGLASDHEHAGHPDFRFEVTAECLITDPAHWTWHIGNGSTKPMTAQDIENSRHESHALIYTDGYVAVTLYEHCYAMWNMNDGAVAGGSLWNEGEWRLTPESVTRIREARRS